MRLVRYAYLLSACLLYNYAHGNAPPAVGDEAIWKEVLDGYAGAQAAIRTMEMQFTFADTWNLPADNVTKGSRIVSYARAGDKYVMDDSTTFTKAPASDDAYRARRVTTAFNGTVSRIRITSRPGGLYESNTAHKTSVPTPLDLLSVNSPATLDAALKNGTLVLLSTSREKADGRELIKVETKGSNGMRATRWYSPSQGYLPVRYLLCDRVGRPISEAVVKDVAEFKAADGAIVYYPLAGTVRSVGSAKGIKMTVKVDRESVRINEFIDSERFELPPAPGETLRNIDDPPDSGGL